METLEQIKELLRYNSWANRSAVKSIADSGQADPKALRALSHLVIAERTWLMRVVDPASAPTEFWSELTLEDCNELADGSFDKYQELLRGLTEEELGTGITYTNSSGAEFTTPLRQILTHVLIHSAYHRGQVASALRAGGNSPANTDYIAFTRQR